MVDQDIHAYFGGTTTGLDAGNGQTYDLHADTRAKRDISWRKQTVDNPWVEGSYDVQAVRGDVIEDVAVWVYGNDQNEFWQRVFALTAYLAQPSWQILWTIDGGTELWTCKFSDHTIETSREFQYNDTGIVRMRIARLPRVTYTYADGSQFVG